MANELAVKVKVNLDTSATKLKDDLKDLESNLQKNPIKIAVKIDKKSLTDSLKDAFGKEAADSIKKNLQSAFGVNAGKTIFDEMSSGADNITKKAQKVVSILGELRKLQDKEKAFTLQYDGLKGSENRENELAVWKNRIDEVREEYQKLFAELNKYDEIELASGGFDNIAERLAQEKELYKARRADAELLAKSQTNTTSKYTSDEIKEEKAAIDQLITAQEKLDNLQVKYYNELKGGRTDNAVELVQPIQKASEELEAAKKNAADFGINISENKKYMDALADSTTKVAMAQNNANSTLSGNSAKARADEEKAALNAEKDAIEAIIDAENRLAQATVNYNKAKASGNSDKENLYLNEMTQANQDFAVATAAADKLGVAWRTNKDRLDALHESQVKVAASDADFAAAQTKAANATDSLNATISNTIEKANALNATTQKNGAGKVDMTAFNQAFNEFNNIANNTSGKYSELKVKSDALQKSFQKMGIAAGNINTALKDDSAITRTKTNFANLNAQITRFLNNNPRISSNNGIYAQFQALATATEECSGDIDKLRMEEAQLEAQSERLGLTTETLAGKFSRLFKEHFQTAAVMAGIHLTQQGFQQVYQNVVEVDDSMTELKKVTDETDTAYSQFTQRAAKQSRELGADISDYVQTTADWARLGYNLPDSEDLARVSSLFANVGDGIESATQASEYLISTLKGFNLVADDAERVVDVINQVANTEPVSAQDISEILQRSAAALSASNTSFEKTVALGTAMNSVLQNSATTGTALKTLSMYLRATKTELEENGEDAEYCASSMSELRDSILALTKGKVDIQLDDDSYKDVYDIMQEISQVYDDLTDKEQASLLNLLGGKRNANAVQALIQQFSIAEDTMKQAANSTGSAMKENDTYMSSIQGKLDQLSSSFQNLSINLLDSNIVKFFADLAINVTDFADSLVKANALVPTLISAVSAYGTLSKKDFGKVNMPAYIHCHENIGCRSINTPLVCWETLKPYSPIAC